MHSKFATFFLLCKNVLVNPNTQLYRRKMEFMEFFEEQDAVLRQMTSSLRMGTKRSFSEVMWNT
jgi:hypothetical protein